MHAWPFSIVLTHCISIRDIAAATPAGSPRVRHVTAAWRNRCPLSRAWAPKSPDSQNVAAMSNTSSCSAQFKQPRSCSTHQDDGRPGVSAFRDLAARLTSVKQPFDELTPAEDAVVTKMAKLIYGWTTHLRAKTVTDCWVSLRGLQKRQSAVACHDTDGCADDSAMHSC